MKIDTRRKVEDIETTLDEDRHQVEDMETTLKSIKLQITNILASFNREISTYIERYIYVY